MKRHILIPLGLVLVVVAGIIWYAQGVSQVTATTPASVGKKSQTNTASPRATTPSFDKTTHSHTDPASIWVVVNKQHQLNPKTYTPGDLTPAGNGQVLRAEAAAALTEMFAGAKQAGLTLTSASGYRSYDTQVKVYNNEVKNYGQATADSESARPGYSEHQTGLAIDIAGGGCTIEDCFGNTLQGKWAATNAHKYGYILRYTPENTSITGYRGESWHFRYVGIPLATELHDSGITTLEKFFGVTGGSY